MHVIYKYAYKDDMLLPPGARILSMQYQRGELQVWCLISREAMGLPKTIRRFVLVGTGHDIDVRGWSYITTVQENNGEYVWHIFERN